MFALKGIAIYRVQGGKLMERWVVTDPVPPTWEGFTTVWHGPPGATGLAAQEEPHAVTGDRCERRAGTQVKREAQVVGVEFDADGNVVDHVAHADRRHGFALLLVRGACLGSNFSRRGYPEGQWTGRERE